MKKIKVLHIISDTNFGGAGQYLKAITEHLSKETFELHVALPKDSKLKNLIKSDHIVEIQGIADQSFGVSGVVELYRYIKIIKPEIVHTHGSLSGRVAAQLYGVPKIIYTKHTLSPSTSGLKQRIKKLLNKILRAKVIAVSKEVQKNLLKEGIRAEDIHVVYNGIPSKPIEASVDHEIPIIALVGRLERIKGHHHMLEVTRKLVQIWKTPIRVLFTGDGSLKQELSELIETEHLPIEMTGHIQDIDRIYNMADIVVNSSESEALPFSVLEAMNAGKPVVAFALPSICEVIEDNQTGYLVPMFNHAEFAEKLKVLLNNKDLRTHMGELGHKRVEEVFSQDQMIQKIEALYREDL